MAGEVETDGFNAQPPQQSKVENIPPAGEDVEESGPLDAASTESNWIAGWRLHILSLGFAFLSSSYD
jgi:hypothetical protein